MEKNLSSTIRNIRLENEMSLRKFSEWVGVSHSHIDKLEKNPEIQNQATIDTLLKISQALAIPFKDFLCMCGYFDNKSDTNTNLSPKLSTEKNTDMKYHCEKFISTLKSSKNVTYGDKVFDKKDVSIIIESLEIGIELAKQNSLKKIKPKN